jgi:hypothetical protein
MKKVLSTALALGLVAGIASTAAAYDSFSIRGYYSLEGNYATNTVRSNGVLDAGADLAHADSYSSAWYYHEFRAYPVMKVNDKTTLKAEVRLLHDDWGGGNDSHAAGSDVVDWDKLWLEYDSPLGMIHAGTTPWGSWGTSFGDGGSRMNSIKYFPNMLPAPFTSVIFTGKVIEEDSELLASDEDNDYYEGRFGYKTDVVEAQIGLGLSDYQNDSTTSVNKWRVRGYAKTSFAGLSIEGEFDHYFGDSDPDVGDSTDYDAWAAYAHVGGKAGNVAVGVLGWLTTGQDETSDDNEAYGHAGIDFEPLLIATGDDFGLLQDNTKSIYSGAVNISGQVAVGAYASMPVSDKLTLTTVIGSAWADDTSVLEGMTGTTIDDHYGWEIDVKADYKLLDNLTYSLNFGYFAAGDLFEDAHMALAGIAGEDDIILVNHTLNMAF